MRSLCIVLLLAGALSSETVDRLAIAVGSTVITELQVDEDVRVAALLNGQPIRRDLESRRGAADRLIEQLLIQHEIELSHYPAPSEQEVDSFYASVQQTLGGPEHAKQLISEYQLSAETLRAHLLAQLTTLRFIEFRFRPDINVSEAEVEAAYRRKLAEFEALNSKGPVPVFDTAEKTLISNNLLEQLTDAALNSWLAEARKQINIVYLDSQLR